ncbi:hypothetical protein [Jeotgalibacillus soli]|uniref:Gas vesicle protein n=1 Tax=Jeotgalibacillus soli TaxID=889306 RepID=A0A0C2VT89_9BACL|nr:hypothetical protein [Jeotgalibacillus soli]KIL47223.1 hypothetical protein KP78_17960 [Jeotgalibacillus soli]
MSNNKLTKGILIGAFLGGALSLIDRETRRQTFENAKKSGQAISDFTSNPKELANRVKVKADQLRITAEQLQEDFEFLSTKVNEVKEMTPKIKNIINETKETFESSGETVKKVFEDDEEKTASIENSQPSAALESRNIGDGKKTFPNP